MSTDTNLRDASKLMKSTSVMFAAGIANWAHAAHRAADAGKDSLGEPGGL